MIPEWQGDKVTMSNERSSEFEAGSWLAIHQDGFTADRFSSPGSALAFVERLYAAGVVRVALYNDDSGPSMNFMRVTLPTNPEQRAAIFAICNKEIEDHGENFSTEREYEIISKEQAEAMGVPEAEGEEALVDEPIKDKGQTFMTLWWD